MTIELFKVLTICFFDPREKFVGKEGVKREVELIKGVKRKLTLIRHMLCVSHGDRLITSFISYSLHNNYLKQT